MTDKRTPIPISVSTGAINRYFNDDEDAELDEVNDESLANVGGFIVLDQSYPVSTASAQLGIHVKHALCNYRYQPLTQGVLVYSARGASNDLENEFNELKEKWLEETMFVSSINEISMNFNYQRIIGMGKPVLPFIFKELEKNPNHWFWALKAITGVDPIDERDRGNLEEMTNSWKIWAENNGYR
ncbi:MAG: hypothetical protein L0Z73_08715 [Gammaproteobacteria bacterium]|nr:hypothetical protein [Gammaproteobacteria bacterium]